MKKKDLLLDMDEVIVFCGFLDAVNNYLKTNYTFDDISDYYIDNVLIPKEKIPDFYSYINTINIYKEANILPKAIETIQKLNNYYNIYVLSSWVNETDNINSEKILLDKYHFLRKNLPFLNPKNFIFTSAKRLLKADVQIDDLITNFSENNNVSLKILFPSYHNKQITNEELAEKGVIRASDDWNTAWEKIEKILMNYWDK